MIENQRSNDSPHLAFARNRYKTCPLCMHCLQRCPHLAFSCNKCITYPPCIHWFHCLGHPWADMIPIAATVFSIQHGASVLFQTLVGICLFFLWVLPLSFCNDLCKDSFWLTWLYRKTCHINYLYMLNANRCAELQITYIFLRCTCNFSVLDASSYGENNTKTQLDVRNPSLLQKYIAD